MENWLWVSDYWADLFNNNYVNTLLSLILIITENFKEMYNYLKKQQQALSLVIQTGYEVYVAITEATDVRRPSS